MTRFWWSRYSLTILLLGRNANQWLSYTSRCHYLENLKFHFIIGQSRPLFSLFSSFQKLTENMSIIKICQWLDLNRRPLCQLSHNHCPKCLTWELRCVVGLATWPVIWAASSTWRTPSTPSPSSASELPCPTSLQAGFRQFRFALEASRGRCNKRMHLRRVWSYHIKKIYLVILRFNGYEHSDWL